MIDPEELARARAPASATLDFASGVPEDRELLNQIAAFANGDGGRLLLGVSSRRSQTGAKRALAVPGIRGSADTAIARVQGLLDRIQPKVSGVAIRAVGDYKRGAVIEIRIPSSDGAPHAVDGVFRVRRGIASEVITGSEVRAVEERQKEMRGRLATFISSRLKSVNDGPTRVSFGDDRPPLLVAHLIPRSSIVTRLDIDYDRLSVEQQYQLRPMRSQTHGGKFEQEGFVTCEEGEAYTLLLRNGAIETVGVVPSNRRLKRLIDVNMVSALREAICRYVDVQFALAAEPPLYLSLALLDAEGYRIGTSGSTIDREGIAIESQVIYGDPLPALKVILDRLWQTAGHAYCPFLEPR